MIGAEEMAKRFTYHPPRSDDEIQAYARIRSMAHDIAQHIDQVAPDSREKSLAITAIEEAVMWANAAIARNGLADTGSGS